MNKLIALLTLCALGAGCSQVQNTSSTQSNVSQSSATTASPTWQTYTDTVRGFSLKYPNEIPVDLGNGSALSLPPSVGNKERTLNVHVSAPSKIQLDADGCLPTAQQPTEKKKLTINGIPFCMTAIDEGAAGSTYRTYDFVTRGQYVVDLQFVIRFPTSVRVYQGCEQDADQSKQTCLDLAFQEERDTSLFHEIVGTFQSLNAGR